MKRVLILVAIITLIFSVDGFGQARRQKPKRNFLPEVNDEVLVRRKQAKRTRSTKRKKPFFDEADALWGKRRKSRSGKYANQEVCYRKKSKRKKVRSLTHDPEFENWANRNQKNKKIRRKNK